MFNAGWRSIVLILGETALLVAAVGAAAWVRLGEFAWTIVSGPAGAFRVALVVGVCQICLHYGDLYNLRTIVDIRDLFIRLFQALGVASLILAFAYFWFPDWIIGRGVFLIAAAFVIFLVVAWRVAFPG